MDRSSLRSFRALDVAEHGLKELARSRLDTTREVVFQPVGVRFVEAREDLARITALFREDAFYAEQGYFSRLRLRVERELVDRLSSIEPRAVERRLDEATRATLQRELRGRQGVYVVRFEPAGRGGLEPVADVHLSCRLSDGGAAPALSGEGAQRFEESWTRAVERAFNMTRPVSHERERATERAPAENVIHLRHEWGRALARLLAAHTDRLAGRAAEKDFTGALAQARSARQAWVRELAPPLAARGASRLVIDEIHLKIDGGSRYLTGPLEAQRRDILEAAASRAAGLPENERRLAIVSWPAGRDIHARVYFNERTHPERPPGSLGPEALRSALETRLEREIRRSAQSLERKTEEPSHEMHVHAALPKPRREATAAPAREPAKREEPVGAAPLVVTLDREPAHTAGGAPGPAGDTQKEILDRLEQEPRDWSKERVFGVRLRIPTGAAQIDSMGLTAEESAHVLQRAVDRAYPFLPREGLRDNFLCAVHERALDVRVVVPEKLGWRPDQLRSPQFQQRFIAGFHQALAAVAPTRLSPSREPRLRSIVPGLAIARLPFLLRQAEQEPERVAKEVARAVFDKLSLALPKPFRIMRELGRTVGRFPSRTE